MILHYLVIWQEGKDHQTRRETAMDLEIEDSRDTESAEIRYNAIKEHMADTHNLHLSHVTIINVCRL